MTTHPLDAEGLSKERIKTIAVDFFRWFWNAPGTNAEQGFDEWAAGPGKDALAQLARERAEPVAWLVGRANRTGGTDLCLPLLRGPEEAERYRKNNPDETLVALYASPPVAVGVKPLEWHGPSENVCWAETTIGPYSISTVGGSWWLREAGSVQDRRIGTIDEAKAAAQADYDQRIRSAMVERAIADLRDVNSWLLELAYPGVGDQHRRLSNTIALLAALKGEQTP